MKSKAFTVAVAVAISAILAAPAGASVKRPLWLGVEERMVLGSGGTAPAAISQRIASAGSRYQRVSVSWRELQPDSKFPAGAPASTVQSDATKADDSIWDTDAINQLDDVIRAASCSTTCTTPGQSLKVILEVEGAPDWAQLSPRPSFGIPTKELEELNRYPGSWQPDPAAFGRLAKELAIRYDGGHWSTGQNHYLPKVELFQAWNEPNLSSHLAPQYDDGFHRLSADSYRALLNSFRDGLLASGRSDVKTLAAGLAPFGSPTGIYQGSEPQDFTRDVLCLATTKKGFTAKAGCAGPAKFDIWAAHPYDLTSTPKRAADPAKHRGVMADMPAIRSYLAAAVSLGTAAPAAAKPLWLTEFDWWTNPPSTRYGIPEPYASRYTVESLWRAWQAGAETLVWYGMRDNANWMGGLWRASTYVNSARELTSAMVNADPAKPLLAAFRFPFHVAAGKSPHAWGIVSCREAGRSVQIQQFGKRGWAKVATGTSNDSGTFVVFLPVKGRGVGTWRAVAPADCGGISPSWNSAW